MCRSMDIGFEQVTEQSAESIDIGDGANCQGIQTKLHQLCERAVRAIEPD